VDVHAKNALAHGRPRDYSHACCGGTTRVVLVKTTMLRNLASALFLLTSVLIGLGSLGHAQRWLPLAASLGCVRPDLLLLLQFVWFWVSGCMAVLSALLIGAWWYILRGDRSLCAVPGLIGAFYIVEGIWGAAHVGVFFSLFIVLGALLCATTWLLYREPAPRSVA
jgi:hypothetical protein